MTTTEDRCDQTLDELIEDAYLKPDIDIRFRRLASQHLARILQDTGPVVHAGQIWQSRRLGYDSFEVVRTDVRPASAIHVQAESIP